MIELVIAAILQISTLTNDGSTTGTQPVPDTTVSTSTTTTTTTTPGGTGNWGDGD